MNVLRLAIPLLSFILTLGPNSHAVVYAGETSSPDQILQIVQGLADPQVVTNSKLREYLGTLVRVDSEFQLPEPNFDKFYESSINELEKIRVYRATKPTYIEVTLIISKEICISEASLARHFEKLFGIPSVRDSSNKDVTVGWVRESGGPDWNPRMTLVRAKIHSKLLVSYRLFSGRSDACVDNPKFIFSTQQD